MDHFRGLLERIKDEQVQNHTLRSFTAGILGITREDEREDFSRIHATEQRVDVQDFWSGGSLFE